MRYRDRHDPPSLSATRLRRPKWWFAAPLVVLALGVVLSFLPRTLLYPAPQVRVPPAPSPWLEVAIPLPDGTHLHGWWREGGERLVLLFFHGNGENLGTLAGSPFLEQLAGLGAAALVVDYPGYGRSPGRPCEAALHAAADASLLWAEGHATGRPVVAWGWSLGAAVAIPLAARAGEHLAGLIAASPWTRLEDVATEHFPRFLVHLLLSERYDSLAAGIAVRVPALVLHGNRDPIIPVSHGRRVAATLAGPTRYVEIPGAGHNDLFSHPLAWRAVVSFLAGCKRP